MYPRNAASPPRLSVGAVIQISDGAVQTAGVSIVVRPEGGSETAGGGTLSYGATSGVVYYTPTQAETDYTAFAVVAYKTGCIPAEKSVVTSASATAGHAGTDQGKIANPTSAVNLSGTTIKTATDVETDTQGIQSRLPAALVDGRIVALAQAVTDKTGYKLASDGLALVTAWTVNITGNITGSLSGSVGSVTGAVGSISGVSFPSNFGALGIDPGGAIVSVQTVEELSANALTANGAGDAIETYVWGALLADHTTANTFGARVVRSVNSNNQVEMTGGGSHHIFAVIHDSEPNSIHEDAFDDGAVSARVIANNAITSDKIATDAITSTQLAASAVTEVKDAIATITPIADLATMIINDGTANARYSVSALQNGPSGEGGQTINVYPVSASTPERVAGTTITFYRDEARAVSVVTDFTLTSLTLRFVIEDNEGADVLVVEDGSITKSSQTFTVSIPDTVTANPTNYRWALRDVTGSTNSVLARGVFSVQEAASDA